ncbi:MAG TPA: DoxX family membrane protein [Steroidobacteraceae bacterium]|nr:DoxX family membrane protein [Steroidobacteraceae bacterium]
MFSVVVAIFVRCLLVSLFLPFSALDKILNFPQAVDQASEALPARPLAASLIVAGFGVEVAMSAAILAGVADRLAALILAGYCIVTAILWKPFWRTADFRLQGASRGREMFWDFLKNLALAGGFLMLTTGTNAAGVQRFLEHPLASSAPYAALCPRDACP